MKNIDGKRYQLKQEERLNVNVSSGEITVYNYEALKTLDYINPNP